MSCKHVRTAMIAKGEHSIVPVTVQISTICCEATAEMDDVQYQTAVQAMITGILDIVDWIVLTRRRRSWQCDNCKCCQRRLQEGFFLAVIEAKVSVLDSYGRV